MNQSEAIFITSFRSTTVTQLYYPFWLVTQFVIWILFAELLNLLVAFCQLKIVFKLVDLGLFRLDLDNYTINAECFYSRNQEKEKKNWKKNSYTMFTRRCRYIDIGPTSTVLAQMHWCRQGVARIPISVFGTFPTVLRKQMPESTQPLRRWNKGCIYKTSLLWCIRQEGTVILSDYGA